MPTIAKPKANEDVRLLHNYVRELVKGTNALLNMSAKMEGRISGLGGLEVSGGSARLKINTGDPGAFAGGDNKKATPITLISSSNPTDIGAHINFMATVADDASGVIQFFVDGVAFSPPISIPGGSAVSPIIVVGTGFFTAGNHVIQANYGGNALYFPVSATLIEMVNALNRPTVDAFGNPNPATEGAHLFLGANVTGQNPIPPAPNITGNVRFFVNGSNVGDYPLAYLSGLTWRAVTGNLANNFGVGNTPVQAMYLGDRNYGTASDSYTQQVKAISTVHLTIDPNPVRPDQLITFHVNVTVPAGLPAPTGTVNLSIGGVPYLSPQALDSSGQATFTAPDGLPIGEYALAAYYSGDSRYSEDFGDVITLKVRASVGIDVGPMDVSQHSGDANFGVTIYVANHLGEGDPQKVRITGFDSYCEVRDVSGGVIYAGQMVFYGGTPVLYPTPYYSTFVIGPAASFPGLVGVIGWFKFQIQHEDGTTEAYLYSNDANIYIDSSGSVAVCNMGMWP